jgi:hypothetical protein
MGVEKKNYFGMSAYQKITTEDLVKKVDAGEIKVVIIDPKQSYKINPFDMTLTTFWAES